MTALRPALASGAAAVRAVTTDTFGSDGGAHVADLVDALTAAQ